jgi:hypothetical protein
MMPRFDFQEATMSITEPQLRSKTPGHDGWARTARPDDPNQFFIVSTDCRAIEPSNFELAKGWT